MVLVVATVAILTLLAFGIVHKLHFHAELGRFRVGTPAA